MRLAASRRDCVRATNTSQSGRFSCRAALDATDSWNNPNTAEPLPVICAPIAPRPRQADTISKTAG